jgi:hypothetical protein
MAVEHERRQRTACEDLKQEYIQPIDLHEFKPLRTVSVHATDLLGAMNKDDPAGCVTLSSVLPPALEVLTLRYSNFFSDWDPQLKFIYENDVGHAWGYWVPWDVVEWVTAEHGDWYETYFGHLADLLRDKTEKFPGLREITTCLQQG